MVEYHIVNSKSPLEIKELNKLGENGWILTTIEPHLEHADEINDARFSFNHYFYRKVNNGTS